MDTSQFVTKKEVEEIVERVVERVVGRVVGEIVGEALQLISERFDRLEVKLDALSDVTKHHAIDIRALQRKPA